MQTNSDMSPDPLDTPKKISLLIVDDDEAFARRLALTLGRKGFEVSCAHTLSEAREIVKMLRPDYAIVDMRLEDGNGLDFVTDLKRISPETRSLILTGYGNLTTAVAAIKMGAVDYLAKPISADEILSTLLCPDQEKPEIPENPMSPSRVRWEHIQRIYELCNRNISETARRLQMHRRTLQRILAKHRPS